MKKTPEEKRRQHWYNHSFCEWCKYSDFRSDREPVWWRCEIGKAPINKPPYWFEKCSFKSKRDGDIQPDDSK